MFPATCKTTDPKPWESLGMIQVLLHPCSLFFCFVLFCFFVTYFQSFFPCATYTNKPRNHRPVVLKPTEELLPSKPNLTTLSARARVDANICLVNYYSVVGFHATGRRNGTNWQWFGSTSNFANKSCLELTLSILELFNHTFPVGLVCVVQSSCLFHVCMSMHLESTTKSTTISHEQLIYW